MANPALMDLTPEQLEDYKERAAIMEYDGGLSRTEAEAEALQIVLECGKIGIRQYPGGRGNE